MKFADNINRSGMTVAWRTLLVGAVVMVLFLAGFWFVLELAGGGEETAGTGDAAAPGEEAATTEDPVLPDTTDDTGATAVEGNPAQDPTR